MSNAVYFDQIKQLVELVWEFCMSRAVIAVTDEFRFFRAAKDAKIPA